MQPEFLFQLTARLALFSLLIQTVEFLNLRKSWQPYGLWSIEPLIDELGLIGPWKKSWVTTLFSSPFFNSVLVLRVIVITLLFIQPMALGFAFLLLTQIYILHRWRGSFNGGSDSMTILVMMGLAMPTQVGLIFIAVHAVFSYFLAGFVKIRQPSWRNGTALPLFLKSSIHLGSQLVANKIKNPKVWLILGWGTLVFECLFPLSLLSPTLCIYFISLACVFHVANCFFLGLNRFLWAWAATWPSLLFCSSILAART